MDRRDISMVNDSMQRLGDTLLRERMNSQDQANRETARGDRKAEFDQQVGLEERRTAAAEKSAATMEDYRKQVLKDANVQKGIMNVRTQVEKIADMHKAGQINTAEANRQVKLLEKQLRDSPELLIKESGLADVNFQDVADDKGEFKTAPIANSKRLAELRSALVDAEAGGNPKNVADARQALEDFQALTRSAGSGVSETRHEYDTDPDSPTAGKLLRSLHGKIEGQADKPSAVTKPAANAKRPTRAKAREYVDKFGKQAAEKLKADGYDVSGYAD